VHARGDFRDLEILSAEERLRHARFVFDRDARDYAAAHGLLRRALSACGAVAPADWQLHALPNHKPRIVPEQAGEPPLLFSLSHTQGFVACAAARGMEVGIDVESIERSREAHDVARRFFAPKEIAMLDRCTNDREHAVRFLELWTLKEAYVKAIGQGLSVPLDRFSIVFDDAGAPVFEAEQGLPAGPFLFQLLTPRPDVRIGLAVRCDDPAAVRVTSGPLTS